MVLCAVTTTISSSTSPAAVEAGASISPSLQTTTRERSRVATSSLGSMPDGTLGQQMMRSGGRLKLVPVVFGRRARSPLESVPERGRMPAQFTLPLSLSALRSAATRTITMSLSVSAVVSAAAQ